MKKLPEFFLLFLLFYYFSTLHWMILSVGHVQSASVVLCHLKICWFSLNGPCWCKNLPFRFKLCRATYWHTMDHIISLPKWILVIRPPYSKKSNFLLQNWLLKTFDKISCYFLKNWSQMTLISASTVKGSKLYFIKWSKM